MRFSPPGPKAIHYGPLISLGCVSAESKATLGAFLEGPAVEMDRTKSPLWLAYSMEMPITTTSCYTMRPKDKTVSRWVRPKFLACLVHLDT